MVRVLSGTSQSGAYHGRRPDARKPRIDLRKGKLIKAHRADVKVCGKVVKKVGEIRPPRTMAWVLLRTNGFFPSSFS